MGFSAAIRPDLSLISPRHCCFKSYCPRFVLKRVAFMTSAKSRCPSLQIIKSVLNGTESSINDNGATEPARILLEKLFAQTQILEEQTGTDSGVTEDMPSQLNHEILESDLLALLKELKNKEEDLQAAERKFCVERTVINRTKEELEQRETDLTGVCSKHEKLERELKQANADLASYAMEIKDLKIQLKERNQEIAASQSALSMKEHEIDEMNNELSKKSEAAVKLDFELNYKAQLLNKGNEVIKKQEFELEALQRAIVVKEEELEASVSMRKLEKEKFKVAEANLEKQAMQWLLTHEELKTLANQTSKQTGQTNEILEDFNRVKKLLRDVRSELVSSQKSVASYRLQMEQQAELLEQQLSDLEEQRESIMSYTTSLKDNLIEVDSERIKLRVAEAQSQELERSLSLEKELVQQLLEDMERERSSLKQAVEEVSLLQMELERKNLVFEELHSTLGVRETELVDAKLQIQQLKSQQASLQLILDEKDSQLVNVRMELEELNQEIVTLKMLLSGKEEQLIQATALLKEKEENVEIMQDELNGMRMKSSEAETVMEQITEVRNNLVISLKEKENNSLTQNDNLHLEPIQESVSETNYEYRLQKKQLEAELKFTRESLRAKEMEVLAAQRALTIKEEELKTVLNRLHSKEKELQRSKEEMVQDADDLKKLYALSQERIGEKSIGDLAIEKLYALSQERIGEKSIGDLAIEKLQLEAAQLEVVAATSTLEKLAAMSSELLNKASLSIEEDADTTTFPQSGCDPGINVDSNECFLQVNVEVARLSSMTEQLLKDAGIAIDAEG